MDVVRRFSISVLLTMLIFFVLARPARGALAERTTKAACTEGNSIACQNFVREETYRSAKTPLKIFLKDQCEKKNLAACVSRAQVLEAEGRYGEAVQTLETACAADDDDACLELATALGRGGKKDAELKLKSASCDRGSARGCTALAVLVANANPDQAKTLNERACAKGYSPACFNTHSLKEQLVAQKSSCDKGDLYSCTGLASQETSTEEQSARYKALCDQHVEVACKLSSHLEAELGNEKEAEQGDSEFKKIFWKQCEQGDGEACFGLAVVFDKANEAKRQVYAAKALKILMKGCEQGDGKACAELKASPLRAATASNAPVRASLNK
jgi:TPR repeat protein